MSRTGEIITLQLGNYSNYVGAHYFNLQDPNLNPELQSDFSHKVLWREGENLQKQRIITPRALIFDLKDNWCNKFVRGSDTKTVGIPAASRQANLDNIQQNIAWDGSIQRVVLPGDNSDSDLEQDSEVNKRTKREEDNYNQWGEYSRWRLHNAEKFAFRIPNFMYNSETDKLVSYGQGLEIYKKIEENVIDGIRIYAEDCDYLEGFHLLTDEYDGFAGIAGGVLEHLGDEYDKKACLGLGLNQPIPESENSTGPSLKDYRIRISNMVQLWSSFSHHARVFSSLGVCEDTLCLNPVSRKFTGVVQDCNVPFISSAIIASALDTLTSPYRLTTPSFPLHELTSLLNAFGHKMTLINSMFPFNLTRDTLFQTLKEEGLSALTPLTPNVEFSLEHSLGNIFVVRGVDKNQVISNSDSREYRHVDINSVTSCFELYCQESFSRSVHVVKDIPKPFKSSFPFPKLYDMNFLNSCAIEKRSSITEGDQWLLPAIASAHNTPAVGDILEKIVRTTGGGIGGSSQKMKSFYEPASATCNGSTIEFEDYAECVNNLSSLRETYLKE